VKLTKNAALAALIGVALVGVALRLYRLDAVPLRGDEAFSVLYWARLPLAQSLTTIAPIEPHPLLTYLTFRGWGLLAGTGEFPMRALPALINLLGIPALYGLGKRLGGRGAGLVAAAMWGLHPLEIWHAQDARNYGIWASMSAVALWLGVRAVQRDRLADWALYAVGAALAANIYYDELFTLAAFSLFVLVTRWGDWRLIRRLLLAQAPAVVTAGSSFLVLQAALLTRGGYGGTAGNFDAARLPAFLTTLVFGKDLPERFVGVIWLPVLLALVAGLVVVWRWRREQAVFLGLGAFVPLALLSVLSLRLRIFAPHYILSAVPAYILILVMLLVGSMSENHHRRLKALRLPEKMVSPLKWAGKGIPMALAALWLGIAGYTLNNYYHDPAYIKASDWPKANAYLHDYVKGDDLVIQLAIDPAFGYYYDAPALDIALPSYPAQSAEEISARLEEFTADRRGIWLVGQPYPDWPNRAVVEMWMAAHFQPVLNTQAAGLHIQQFMPWEVRNDEIEAAPLAVFGDVVELRGVKVFRAADDGEPLTVWLYWRAVGQSDAPLKVFVHLGDNAIVSQDDQYPQDGRIDTTRWAVGETYRDVYTLLLAGVAPGVYSLRAGLYAPETNARLVTANGEDFALVGSVSVES